MSLVYVFLADGFEEVEGLTAVDLLRRAGADVKMVSIMGRQKIQGSHGISVEADMLFDDLTETADMLVLPGGLPGTNYLREHDGLAELLKKQYEAKRWVAAICAAPSVFAGLGFLEGRKATSYPGCVDDTQCGTYLEEPAVVDGNVVTSRGVGTAIPFALTLIEVLVGKDKAEEIAASIIYQ
ncbi:MAG: DJ-1/PfpI family protein [Clostridiales bacterium]|nr:DJ-1/PfpI family protein [Clostridiales bacterium]